MTVHDEIEVKFPLTAPGPVRDALRRMGATGGDRHHEYNLRFDDPDRTLRANGIVLRLRRTDGPGGIRYILTYKVPVPSDDPSFLIRREWEVNVDDGDTMREILEAFGYQVVWRYEKYREVYHWQDVEAVLDETPIGWFLELEGPQEGIRELAEALGLPMAQSLAMSYAELFERARLVLNLAVEDMTFEELAGRKIAPDEYLAR